MYEKYKPFADDVETLLYKVSQLHLASLGQKSSSKRDVWRSRKLASVSLLYDKNHGKASKDSILTETNKAIRANEDLGEWGWVTMGDDDDVAHYASTVFAKPFSLRRVNEGMWKQLMKAQSEFVDSLEDRGREFDLGTQSIPELEEINKSLMRAKEGQAALEWVRDQADMATANAVSTNEEVDKNNESSPQDDDDGESRGNKGKGKATAT